MRKLKTSDVFSLARLIKISGIRGELTEIVTKIQDNGELDLRKVGIDTVFVIIEALSEKKAEQEIYDLLAPIMEVEPAEVENMGLEELLAALKKIGEENDLESFFKSASGIVGKI